MRAASGRPPDAMSVALIWEFALHPHTMRTLGQHSEQYAAAASRDRSRFTSNGKPAPLGSSFIDIHRAPGQALGWLSVVRARWHVDEVVGEWTIIIPVNVNGHVLQVERSCVPLALGTAYAFRNRARHRTLQGVGPLCFFARDYRARPGLAEAAAFEASVIADVPLIDEG